MATIEERQAAVRAMIAKNEGSKRQRQEATNEVEPQRTRMVAQGLTFGFADEIEAAVRAAASGDVTYEEAIADIRKKIDAYKEAEPWTAAGYELLGAAPTAFIGGAPATTARMLGRAGLEGALYAAGTAEGGIGDRLAAVPGGAVGGVAGGAVMSGLTSGATALASGVVDYARQKLGDKGASVVNRELQRMARTTGLTTDELVEKIATGQILSENATLQNVARAYYSNETPAKGVIHKAMEPRPAAKRAEALSTAQRKMTNITSEDIAGEFEKQIQSQQRATSKLYAPTKVTPASDELRVAMADAIERVPSAADDLQKMVDIELKGAPFYHIAKREDGSSYVIFTREPTQYEAELVYRAIRDTVKKAKKEGSGGVAEALSEVRDDIKGIIDEVAPDVAAARASARVYKGNEEAFAAGQKAFSGDPFEKISYYNSLSGEAKDAFRAGVMQMIRQASMAKSRPTLAINQIANNEGGARRIIEAVLPEADAAKVLQAFDNAKLSQEASGYILKGSGTAGTQQATKAIGSGTTAVDAAARAMLGDPSGLTLMARKFVAENSSLPLTDKQMTEVAELLVNTNPEVVKRALTDDSAMAGLVDLINKTGAQVARGARVGGAQQAGEYTGQETKAVPEGLLNMVVTY